MAVTDEYRARLVEASRIDALAMEHGFREVSVCRRGGVMWNRYECDREEIGNLVRAVAARARAEAMEEAARVCERESTIIRAWNNPLNGISHPVAEAMRAACAAAIRARVAELEQLLLDANGMLRSCHEVAKRMPAPGGQDAERAADKGA